MMGLTDSPYHACQSVTRDNCIAMGDQLDSNNNVTWEKGVLNCPGTKEYIIKGPMCSIKGLMSC